jgi:Domain of unknown function (DUF932)
MSNITTASQQWASRPDDQRFETLEALRDSVAQRRRESWTATPATNELRIVPAESNGILVEAFDPTKGERRALTPTNFAFGQLAAYAGAPASYLRKLPSELAAINLQWGLEHKPQREEALLLAQSNGTNSMRAMTSTSYGRIWDAQVVDAVERVNQDGRWQIPAASYATRNPKRATTLYASDRDVFIFLVDPKNPVEVGGEQLFRGFYTWNSEVGSAVFGLCTFLYRFICDNRIIWGASEVKELRIRHTGGAPDRFAYEGAKYLRRYADEGTAAIAGGIKAAQNKDIATEINTGKGDTVQSWLQKRGFTKAQAAGSVESAQAEMGGARSLWEIVNGITAYARSVPHTDERVQLEAKAGKLMELVS